MLRLSLIGATMLLASSFAVGEEPTDVNETESETDVTEVVADGIEKPKTMSGMSILGNEEAPKSLVIIPWKSSQLGDDINLSDTLADRAQPVDKEVFLRELSFHEIRATE